MDIKEMNFDELETRKGELAEEIGEADMERLSAINLELDAIEERKKELKAEAEERAKTVEEVINAPAPTPIITERKTNTMEIRNSKEYINAYAEFVKGGYKDDTECRALLTDNLAEAGEGNSLVPVPSYLEDRIRTAWEKDEILSRVAKTFIKGNVKVGYEISATGATVHTEGGDPVAEEDLQIGIVELVPVMIKKWVSVSDEALGLTGQAFLDYLFDEIQYRIVKKLASEILTKIASSSLTATATAASGDLAVITAFGELSDEATDIVCIMNRGTYVAIKSAAIGGNFAFDPFNGFPVLFSDAVADDKVIVGDLKGVTVNFPEGDEPKFIFDDRTLMTSDLVRILGRLYAAYEVTAPGRFALVTISA